MNIESKPKLATVTCPHCGKEHQVEPAVLLGRLSAGINRKNSPEVTEMRRRIINEARENRLKRIRERKAAELETSN